MDPNGNYTSEEDYICYVSPLHQALRGTNAMPTLQEFLKSNNPMSISNSLMNGMSITPEPIEEAMFPSAEHSTFSYLMDVALPPPILPSSSTLAAPADSTSPFVSNFTVPSTIQGNTLDISDYGVFDPSNGSTSPFVGNFMAPSSIQGNPLANMDAGLNSNGVFNPSMDSTSPFVGNFMAPSTIQENSLPIMDASRNSYGVLNPSPVSEYPEWLVYGEQKPNTILRSSPNGTVPPVNAAHISPFPESTQAPPGIQRMVTGVPNVSFHKNLAPSSSSAVSAPRGLYEYKCKRCEMTFQNPQAYGGHMSSHSKTRKSKRENGGRM